MSTPLREDRRYTRSSLLSFGRSRLIKNRYCVSDISPPSSKIYNNYAPGPLLTPTNYNTSLSTYIDCKSPGLAGRIVQYNDSTINKTEPFVSHQAKYGSPGLFPIVHLQKKDLPVRKLPRDTVTVRLIATPDSPSSSMNRSGISNASNATDMSTRNVLKALRAISKKRMLSEDLALQQNNHKRQRNDRIEVPENNIDLTNGNNGDVSKKLKSDIPCVVDAVAASLTSSNASLVNSRNTLKRKISKTALDTPSPQSPKQMLIEVETQTENLKINSVTQTVEEEIKTQEISLAKDTTAVSTIHTFTSIYENNLNGKIPPKLSSTEEKSSLLPSLETSKQKHVGFNLSDSNPDKSTVKSIITVPPISVPVPIGEIAQTTSISVNSPALVSNIVEFSSTSVLTPMFSQTNVTSPFSTSTSNIVTTSTPTPRTLPFSTLKSDSETTSSDMPKPIASSLFTSVKSTLPASLGLHTSSFASKSSASSLPTTNAAFNQEETIIITSSPVVSPVPSLEPKFSTDNPFARSAFKPLSESSSEAHVCNRPTTTIMSTLFGSSTTTPSIAFGSLPTASTVFGPTTATAIPFGAVTTPTVTPFSSGTTTTVAPFGSVTTTAATPFGFMTTATATLFSPVVTATAAQFGSVTTAAVTPFGSLMTAAATPFAPMITATSTPFGSVATATVTPFSSMTTTTATPFGSVTTATGTPFDTVTTATATPFSSITTTAMPFGSVTAATGSSFGSVITATASPFSSTMTGIPFGLVTTAASTPFGSTSISEQISEADSTTVVVGFESRTEQKPSSEKPAVTLDFKNPSVKPGGFKFEFGGASSGVVTVSKPASTGPNLGRTLSFATPKSSTNLTFGDNTKVTSAVSSSSIFSTGVETKSPPGASFSLSKNIVPSSDTKSIFGSPTAATFSAGTKVFEFNAKNEAPVQGFNPTVQGSLNPSLFKFGSNTNTTTNSSVFSASGSDNSVHTLNDSNTFKFGQTPTATVAPDFSLPVSINSVPTLSDSSTFKFGPAITASSSAFPAPASVNSVSNAFKFSAPVSTAPSIFNMPTQGVSNESNTFKFGSSVFNTSSTIKDTKVSSSEPASFKFAPAATTVSVFTAPVFNTVQSPSELNTFKFGSLPTSTTASIYSNTSFNTSGQTSNEQNIFKLGGASATTSAAPMFNAPSFNFTANANTSVSKSTPPSFPTTTTSFNTFGSFDSKPPNPFNSSGFGDTKSAAPFGTNPSPVFGASTQNQNVFGTFNNNNNQAPFGTATPSLQTAPNQTFQFGTSSNPPTNVFTFGANNEPAKPTSSNMSTGVFSFGANTTNNTFGTTPTPFGAPTVAPNNFGVQRPVPNFSAPIQGTPTAMFNIGTGSSTPKPRTQLKARRRT